LYCNEVTATAPGFFRDEPHLFGIPSRHLLTECPLRNKVGTSPLESGTGGSFPPQPSVVAPPLDSFEPGKIVVGMASITNIIESIECISGYSAEGGAYDPIVIKELAQRYITSLDQIQTHSTTISLSPTAIASSSAAVTRPTFFTSDHDRRPHWGYESLGPGRGEEDPTFSVSALLPSSIALPKSVHDAVNICQWNCHIARSVGLAGHSMIWNALMSLIPVITLSTDSNACCFSQGSSSTQPESSSLNYAMETLCELLVELIDCGDCQHFVICCEIVRNIDDHQPPPSPDPLSPSQYPSHSSPSPAQDPCSQPKKSIWKTLQQTIGEMRIREGYVAYLELLFRLGLYQISNSIIFKSTDKYITQLSQQGVIVRSSCAQCGKELNLDSAAPTSATQLTSSRITSIWCTKCRKCVDLCHLCQQPVKGLLHWCPVCGHGGHPDCVKKWFERFETCPSACGHKCLSHHHYPVEEASLCLSPAPGPGPGQGSTKRIK
jgi:hypothetical protein